MTDVINEAQDGEMAMTSDGLYADYLHLPLVDKRVGGK